MHVLHPEALHLLTHDVDLFSGISRTMVADDFFIPPAGGGGSIGDDGAVPECGGGV